MRAVFAFLLLLAGPAWGQSEGNPSFVLANRGAQVINELYATPAGVERWGQDRLAQYSLAPGRTYPVRLPADGSCVYDIRVVYADGKPEERRRVNTCTVDSIGFPGGQTTQGGGAGAAGVGNDPSFRLVNRGRSDASEVYVSPSADDDWGEDRLGKRIVEAGGSRIIRMAGGQCTYDVRVVFANGDRVERRRLNLCTITDLRVP